MDSDATPPQDPNLLQVGDTIDVYRVVEVNHIGRLPLARIRNLKGVANAGLTVILTSPYRRAEQ